MTFCERKKLWQTRKVLHYVSKKTKMGYFHKGYKRKHCLVYEKQGQEWASFMRKTYFNGMHEAFSKKAKNFSSHLRLVVAHEDTYIMESLSKMEKIQSALGISYQILSKHDAYIIFCLLSILCIINETESLIDTKRASFSPCHVWPDGICDDHLHPLMNTSSFKIWCVILGRRQEA